MGITKNTIISLCSGYGGIERGLKRVLPELRVLAHSEIEAYPVAVLLSKMESGEVEEAPVWTNLKTFPGHIFRDKVGVLTGGFPCQPFSLAGRKRGDLDPRHLFPYFLKIIKEIQPEQIFLENVNGILSAKLSTDEWRDPKETPVLLHVLRELERLGYNAEAGIFSADEVGAIHERKRIFILANRKDIRCGGREHRDSSHGGRIQVQEKDQRTMVRSEAERCSRDLRSSSDSVPNGISEGWKRREFSNETSEVRETSCESVTRCNSDGMQRLARPGQIQYPYEEPRAYLQPGEEMETQPELGGTVNGLACWEYATDERMANRSDRLRMLGNGVVPATAARAYKILSQRLIQKRK